MALRGVAATRWLLIAVLVLLWTEAAAGEVSADHRVILQAGGDVSYANRWMEPEVEGRGSDLFRELAPLLRQGDVNFANLESPFTERNAVAASGGPGGFVFVSRPHRLRWVVDAGFNLFSLANNHALDADEIGLFDTIDHLEALGRTDRPLWFAGAARTPRQSREPVIFTPSGKQTKIALFAFGQYRWRRVDWGRSPSALERIRKAADQVDTVVVSVHDGDEYRHVPSAKLARRYRSYIDAGARIVLGHHPHVGQGIERYRDGVIFYSLGNLSFTGRGVRHRKLGAKQFSMMARVVLDRGALARVEAFPLYTSNVDALHAPGQTMEPQHAVPRRLFGVLGQQAQREIIAWSRKVPDVTPTRFERLTDRLRIDRGPQHLATQ